MSMIKEVLFFVLFTINDFVKIVYGALIANRLKIDRNKIVFNNFGDKGYGCNPKYITEELLRRDGNFQLVWLVKNMDEPMPERIRKVKARTFSAYRELATAKVWVSNVRNWSSSYAGIKKKDSQFYIQTFHAVRGFKTGLWQEKATKPDKRYMEAIAQDSTMVDLLITDGERTTRWERRDFKYDGEVMEAGFPRTDIFANLTDEMIKKVQNYFGIDQNCHIILYAPTFRSINRDEEIYRFDYEKIRQALQGIFEREFIMLIRMHNNAATDSKNIRYTDKIMNATWYPDVQELLACAEVCISDYSSVLWESAQAGNIPVVLAKDMDLYVKNKWVRLDHTPFLTAKTEDELIEKMENCDYEEYQKKCSSFVASEGMLATGNASARIADRIEKEITK